MTPTPSLVFRNVEVEGRPALDVRLEHGHVAGVGQRLAAADVEVEGHGGALIPGLIDHHIHLFALAAHASSISLDGIDGSAAFRARIASALAAHPPGGWVRVIGYHEAMAGELSRWELDEIAPRHRLRVQHQSGSLWILNSLALAAVRGDGDPPSVECSEDGRPTGRIWRGDAWLRQRIGAQPICFAAVGRQLAAYGITAATDASVGTDTAAADQLAVAFRSGDLPQRLTLMSGGALQAPADNAFAVGPVKVLLDDHDLPDLDDLIERFANAHLQGRPVAVHCVTATQLALTLAALEAAGPAPGDRIEHGSIIPCDAIPQLRALGLTVVTQPAFVRERGDRYLAEVEAAEHPDLYRCASLVAGGVPVAASSDAPYASPDPWQGISAAVDRKTRLRRRLGWPERVGPAAALSMYLGAPASPGGRPRRVEVGGPADLCLLRAPLRAVLEAPSASMARITVVAGRIIHDADRPAIV